MSSKNREGKALPVNTISIYAWFSSARVHMGQQTDAHILFICSLSHAGGLLLDQVHIIIARKCLTVDRGAGFFQNYGFDIP